MGRCAQAPSCSWAYGLRIKSPGWGSCLLSSFYGDYLPYSVWFCPPCLTSCFGQLMMSGNCSGPSCWHSNLQRPWEAVRFWWIASHHVPLKMPCLQCSGAYFVQALAERAHLKATLLLLSPVLPPLESVQVSNVSMLDWIGLVIGLSLRIGHAEQSDDRCSLSKLLCIKTKNY